MWARLASIVWGLADVPMTRTFSPERVPSHERLFRLYLSILTSFIASVRVDRKNPRTLEFEEGQAEFAKRSLAFNSSRCVEFLQISFQDYVAQEIAIKVKRYNTLKNVPSETKDIESPNELDRYAPCLKGRVMGQQGSRSRLRLAVSRKSKPRPTSGSASLSLPSSGFRRSSSGGAWSMTDLTWTHGWMTISVEGGPERSRNKNGP